MEKNKHVFLLAFLWANSLIAGANSAENEVNVSEGPFAQSIYFNSEQKKYSTWWKEKINSQLGKSVNFAGHYRLFVSPGGHGIECLHDYWVCGWVIDKLTGKVVATLPSSPEGGNSYIESVDDGTPTGLKFKYTAKANSAELTIKGRAANAPIQRDNGDYTIPECRLISYVFNGSVFNKINEVSNGCDLIEPDVVYGH